MKLLPRPLLMLNCAPLKPPRLTSYGVVITELVTLASRGMFEPLNGEPLSVVLFWSELKPSTLKPDGSPSAPATGVTPGIVPAMAFRSPAWLAATAALLALCSFPPMSAASASRSARFRSAAVTLMVSSIAAARVNRASATRISSSAVRLISNRLGTKPIEVNDMK